MTVEFILPRSEACDPLQKKYREAIFQEIVASLGIPGHLLRADKRKPSTALVPIEHYSFRDRLTTNHAENRPIDLGGK